MECRICNNRKGNILYEVKEMFFGFRDKFDYFECSDCKCLQILEIPLNISKYYPQNYYSYNLKDDKTLFESKTNKTKFDYLRDKFRQLRNNYVLFNNGFVGKIANYYYPNTWIKRPFDIHFPGMDLKKIFAVDSTILDVGCGAGKLLYHMKEAGFKNLLGIDPFIEKNIQYANGLSIEKKTIHEVAGKFDVIMFHHSFEHVSDPLETLNSVVKLLSKKGICLIRIPIVSSYAWQHYKENWVGLDAPRHFYLHSKKSMNLLSKKYNLKLRKIVHDSDRFEIIGSEQYKNNIPLMDERSFYKNEETSIFSAYDIEEFENKVDLLNKENFSSTAAFYYTKM